MGLVLLAFMGGLIILANACHSRRIWFGAAVGLAAFTLVPLYAFGDLSLGGMRRYALAGLINWPGVALFVALAVIVYGGLGAAVSAYVRTSRDLRRTRIIYSAVLGAIVSAIAYTLVSWVVVPQMVATQKMLVNAAGVGAFVGLVVAFACTHETVAGRPFFRSRDGGTVLAALIGAALAIGGLNILMQRPPGVYGMQPMVLNLLAGGLLGAGLTIPLRAVEAGRAVRTALGAVIGSVVLSAGFVGGPLAGLVIGALVGALLPDDEDRGDQSALPSPEEKEVDL